MRVILCCVVCFLFRVVGLQGTYVPAFDDTILFAVNWPGNVEQQMLDSLEGESLFMTTGNNEKYLCVLPTAENTKKKSRAMYSGPSALELISPLFVQMSCSYRLESYWTYELCHGRFIRQYHEERVDKKMKLQEFHLGKSDKDHFDEINAEFKQKLAENPHPAIPTKKIEGMNMPYLQLTMGGGTVCDLNGQPRVTHVLYVCYPHGKHEIYSLEESSTCEYEIIVLSPLLCQHPDYRPKESDQNDINCHPVEGAPKKPKSLMEVEAESLKLKHESKLQSLESDDDDMSFKVEVKPLDEAEVYTKPPLKPIFDAKLVEDFLAGEHCLVGGIGWWKYEFCYGKRVDQYHEEKETASRTTIHLGIFNKEEHLEWLETNPHKRPKPVSSRKHVSHFYSGGSICDLTGKPRHVEVKLKCRESESPNSVSLYLLEPRTCEYVLGVESPIICPLLDTADDDGFMHLDTLRLFEEDDDVDEDEDEDEEK